MNKSFKRAVLSLTFLSAGAFGAFTSSAMAWDIDKMNAQIDATNVNVAGVCTGTLIEPADQRLVLTANHCVEDQVQTKDVEEVDPKTGEIKHRTVQELIPLTIFVRKIRDYEEIGRTEYLVRIVGRTKEHDQAVLQVVDKDFVPQAVAKFASEDFKYSRGKRIWLVGNPMGEFDGSVVDGIISYAQRALDFQTGVGKIKLFQYSANTVGGNSGGPIYNDDGEIIGTVTGGMRGTALQFAVPIHFAREMLKTAGLVKPAEVPVQPYYYGTKTKVSAK